jgi:formylmethanofuran dehydrogenase subunit E
MATFPARFESTCNGCGEWIDTGEMIGYVDDVIVCGDCYEADEEASRPKPAQPWRPEHSER